MSTKHDGNASFRRAFYTLAGVLALLCGIMLVLNLQQSPRLRRTEVDRTEVTKQPGQRLVMYANQPLAPISQSQISIEPSANFTASSSGEAVVIQFNERLRYNTTYYISATNVASSYRKSDKITFTYSFKTVDPTIYYLHRNYGLNPDNLSQDKKPDEIIQATPSGSTQTTIFTASKIQEFILAGNNLVVATINDDKTNSLYLVDVQTKKAEKLILPATGTLTNLHASPNQRLVGFTFLSNEKGDRKQYDNILFNIDLVAGRLVYSIKGLDHKPIQVQDWQFAPDGTTILAQTYDSNLLLIDTNAKNTPVPLGQFTYATNFSYDGAKISVSTGVGPVILDALKHTQTQVHNKLIDGIDPYPMNLRLLSNGEGYVERLEVLSYTSKIYRQYIVINRNQTEKTIYKAELSESNIVGFDISPNDQFISIVLEPASGAPNDNYRGNSMSTKVHTFLIDTTTAETIKDIDGFDVIWQ